MATTLDQQRLSIIFQSRPDILEGIKSAADSPARITLFNDIASFVYEKLGDTSTSEPALKRRRVDIDQSSQPAAKGKTTNGTEAVSSADVAKEPVLLEIKEISVSVPQRKKYDLCLTAKHIYAKLPNTTAPVPGIIYAWKDIEYAFYLPVPEKSQVQYNYVLFPSGSYLPTKPGAAAPSPEPLVFTINAGAPKPGSIGGTNAAAAASVSDTYTSLFHWAFNKCLGAHPKKVNVVAADPAKFHSMVRQSHRPNEKAVHVKAFRGSKDGYLFFLENGILWGFKKPLLFLPLDKIAAISYTSVLQRTFNIVIEIFSGEGAEGQEGEETEELEFAMLDQEDYGGINENYVARKGLQDRSMAEARKAKKLLKENMKGEDGEDGGEANGHAGELEKAVLDEEQRLQDDEDEDEEDYDPGSEGESEGSGSSSEDDDDSDAEGAGDEDDEEMDEDEGGDEQEE